MAKTRSGGGNFVSFYTIDTTHSSVGTSAVWSGTLLEQTAFTRGDDGAYTVELTQYADDAALYTFLETYAPEPEEGAIEQKTLEDGATIGGTTGNSPELLMINAGSTDTDDNRKLFTAVVKLATASGSWTQVNGSFTAPSVSAISQKAKADINVASKLPTTLFATSPAVTISSGKRGKVAFQPKA